jgi:hypothetical protein
MGSAVIIGTSGLNQGAFSGAAGTLAANTYYEATVGSDYSKALPASAGVADGAIIEIFVTSLTGTSLLTITRDGSDVIRYCGANLTSMVLARLYAVLRLVKNGAGWDVEFLRGRQNQEVILTTPGATTAGYGTTDTQIRRYTVTNTSTGSALTAATSLANGTTVTLNESGLYTITVSDGQGTATLVNVGVSVNSSQLTTVIESTDLTKRLMSRINPYTTQSAVQYRANAGDVLRAHMGFVKPNITSTDGFLRVTKMED